MRAESNPDPLALDPLSPIDSTYINHTKGVQMTILSPTEQLEDDASRAGLAAAEGLRGVEVVLVVLVGLLVCPPLAILVVLVGVPLLVTAVVLGLLGAVLSTPYLLVRHFRGHHGGHAALLAHRLRRVGRALVDLAPHRIAVDARRLNPGRR